MTTCPCCSNPMLRHVRHHQLYWFCRSCWQEMPSLQRQGLNLVPTALAGQLMPLGIMPTLTPV